MHPRGLAAVIVLVACATPARAPSSGTAVARAPTVIAPRPTGKLVVLLVIDHWPAWSFRSKRPALTGGGFDRLLREGEWREGWFPSPATITSPGHALLGSGEPPAHSGIVANVWWDRQTERLVRSTGDGDGDSAHRLRVPAMGDAIAAAGTGAKAVSISLKNRSALLMLGQAGTAVWYDGKRATWASTRPLPWLAAHERAHPIPSRFGESWTPLDPARLATLSGTVDDPPGEVGDKGFGPTFPHALPSNRDPAEGVFAMPLGNELVLELATAAIDGEHLGADATPDLLMISLSAHDYVGHGWGHESWEAWDMTLRLDRQLADFLTALDAKVGPDGWAMIVTSDHGGAPLPERVGGGRLGARELEQLANTAASTVLGAGAWIASAKYPHVYLSATARAKPSTDQARALDAITAALRALPGLERVERTATFAGECATRTGDAFAYCLALSPDRAGELFYLPAPGWVIYGERPEATGHGSMHDYDRRVPVILAPFGRTPHAARTAPLDTLVQMVRISTLLAHWLGVTPPLSMPRAPPPAP